MWNIDRSARRELAFELRKGRVATLSATTRIDVHHRDGESGALQHAHGVRCGDAEPEGRTHVADDAELPAAHTHVMAPSRASPPRCGYHTVDSRNLAVACAVQDRRPTL